MSTSETVITLYMTRAEKEQIINRAKIMGMTPSRYIKSLIKSDRRKANKGPAKSKVVDYDETVIPTYCIDLRLTEEEWDMLNHLAIQSEQSVNQVLREFIRRGSLITLPFIDRENEIRELTNSVSALIKKADSLIAQMQKEQYDTTALENEFHDFNLNCRALLQQELMAQNKLGSVIRKILREKKVR